VIERFALVRTKCVASQGHGVIPQAHVRLVIPGLCGIFTRREVLVWGGYHSVGCEFGVGLTLDLADVGAGRVHVTQQMTFHE
jgi:hypothetical protein